MTVAVSRPASGSAAIAPARPVAVIVDAAGVWPLITAAEARERIASATFCWLDVFCGDAAERKALLAQLGLEEGDAAWVHRFGQAGRMAIGRRKLRAVTWLAEPSGRLVEVHVLCSPQRILTVWNGDGSGLDELRQHFAERAGAVGKSPYQAAGILLQLLLGTLDHAIRSLDAQLDDLRAQLDEGAGGVDFAALAAQRQELQSAWASFDRYSSKVRAAIVGVEAVPGMDARGAAELDDYAEQVEDVEEQLQERRRWMSEIVHDCATAIAQRQGEQINRLTVVSMIFLPVTAVTGFFGMNFNWMIAALESVGAFFALGVLLPLAMMLITVACLAHRGLIRFGRRPAPRLVSVALAKPKAPRRGDVPPSPRSSARGG